MKNLVLFGLIFFGYSEFATAQAVNLNQLCGSIKKKVVVPLKPTVMFREDVFSNDCVFQFSVERSPNIKLRVERYDSAVEASTELDSKKDSFNGFDALHYEDNKTRHRCKNINPDGFWDRAVAYKDTAKPDHFAILRRDKFLIVILSRDFSVLKKTERLLRKIRFD